MTYINKQFLTNTDVHSWIGHTLCIHSTHSNRYVCLLPCIVVHFDPYIQCVCCQPTSLPYSHQHITLTHRWPLTLARPRAPHIQHGTCVITQTTALKLTRQRFSSTLYFGSSGPYIVCKVPSFAHNVTQLIKRTDALTYTEWKDSMPVITSR